MRGKRVGSIVLGIAAVGALLLNATPAAAKDDTVPGVDEKAKVEKGSIQSSIVRAYAKERLLEVKVERLLEAEAAKPGEPVPPALPKSTLRVGQVIFVDATASRVLDVTGVEQKRDDKAAWFTKDEGWAILKPGQRLRIDYSEVRSVPAPQSFPAGAREKGTLLVYTATLLKLLPVSGVESPATIETGAAQGVIVRLFKAEKLVEMKVETATGERGAAKDEAGKRGPPGVGTLILVRLEQARVRDEKGVERTRDDKDAWFTKDEGWSILDEGLRIKIEYSSTQQVPAPEDLDLDDKSATVMVYNASTLGVLADKK